MFKVGCKIVLARTGEPGQVVLVSDNTYTVLLDKGLRIITSHDLVRRARRCTGPRIPKDATPEELRLSQGLGLTVKQVRNARR